MTVLKKGQLVKIREPDFESGVFEHTEWDNGIQCGDLCVVLAEIRVVQCETPGCDCHKYYKIPCYVQRLGLKKEFNFGDLEVVE